MIVEEDDYDGNLLYDWAFAQQRYVRFDSEKKEIVYNVADQTNHAYNQSGDSNFSKLEQQWSLLLDNQLMCNVIINRKLLTNIRKCR